MTQTVTTYKDPETGRFGAIIDDGIELPQEYPATHATADLADRWAWSILANVPARSLCSGAQ